MIIVRDPVGLREIKSMAITKFGNMVKAVVDVERGIMALDGELHADEEAILIEDGSRQEHLWGINFYPDLSGEDFVEFDSMINLRPSRGNNSRGIEDPEIRKKIIEIINKLIKK